MQQTSDGGYIIAGVTYLLTGAGHLSDVYLIKTTSTGDTLWTKAYGGPGYDEGRSVQQTFDGGYIIAGHTQDSDGVPHDIYLIKTDPSGNTLWTRTYGGPNSDDGYSVQQTSDGGYIIAGYTSDFGTNHTDVYLIKANSSGDTLWTRTFRGPHAWFGYSVQQTSDGGYIVAGNASGDVLLIKTDSSGDTLWTRTYGDTTSGEWGSSVDQTSDGGYIITGASGPLVSSRRDVLLIKTNSSGDTLWTRTYGGSGYQEALSVQQTSDGGYITAGRTLPHWPKYRDDSADVYLVKTDALGETLWTRTFGGTGWDEAYSVQQSSDGGYIIAGACAGSEAEVSSGGVYLIKTRPDGLVSVEHHHCILPAAYALPQNYPNPFNPSTTIMFELPKTSHVTLTVYDILGRRVSLLVNEKKEAGVHEVKFDGSNLGSGVYFYRLQAGGFVQTRKLLLMK